MELMEDIKFEIDYFYDSQMSKILSIKKGIKNLWMYRKLIWNDRWYDFSFLHNLMRFKINDMAQNWGSSHYVGSEYEEKQLKKIVQLFDDI